MEQLALALILSLALAVVFFMRMRRAERQLTNAEEVSEFRARLIVNQDRSIIALLEKIEAKDGEIAELRDQGGTGDAA